MDTAANEARDTAPKESPPHRAPEEAAAPPATPTPAAPESEILDEAILADPKFVACLERLEAHWPKPKVKTPPTALQRLGRFEIRRELGRGRFGVVFLAWDPQLQRQVALKVPLFDAAMDPDLRERFRGEALSAGQLQHSGIVSIFDVGQHAGVDYLAMAFVDGMTLAERLQAGLFSPTEAAQLIIRLARAVQHAHDQGVIHRDLKPSNVLLDKQGEPYVTDFGLARRLSDSAMRATHTGQVLGTPTYMSPEQATGQSDVGPASDIYAIGVILYETITGRPPFQAATFVEAVEFILNRDPLPPSKLNPKLPRELDAITFKCLEKRPAQRYASCAELADDLQCFLEGKPIRARTQGYLQKAVRWARKYPSQAGLLLATLVLIGLTLTMGVVYDRWQHADALAAEQRVSAETQRYFATVNQARNIINRRQPGWSALAQQELQNAAAIKSPVADRRELWQLATECLTGFDVQREATIPAGLLIGRLAASADGQWLAVGELKGNASCRVVVYDTQAREPRHTFTILNDGWKRALMGAAKWQDGVREFAFTSDNRYLAVGMRFGSVYCYDLQKAAEPPRHLVVSKERELEKMAFSADGKTLFAQTKDDEFIRWQDWQTNATYDTVWTDPIRSFAVPQYGETLLTTNHSANSFRLFNKSLEQRNFHSPFARISQSVSQLATDGTGEMVVSEGDHGVQIYETLGGTLLRRLQDDTIGNENIADCLSFSRDGQLLMAFEDHGTVRFFDVARSRQVMRLDLPRHDFQDVALDPQRRWLAVANDKQLEFWRLNPEPIKRTLTGPAEAVEDIAFSPDNKTLACVMSNSAWHSPMRTTLATYASETGEPLALHRSGLDSVQWGREDAQLAWLGNGELLLSTICDARIFRVRQETLQADDCLPLTGVAANVEFDMPDLATERGKTPAPQVKQIPHPHDAERRVWEVIPRGKPIQLRCRLTPAVKNAGQIPTLVLSVKIDADHSFRAPVTAQSRVGGNQPHHAPFWTYLGQRGEFSLWSVPLPKEITDLGEFELTLISNSTVRSLQIERIDYVARNLAPNPASKATNLQFVDHLSLAPGSDRFWGCVAEEVRSWSWPSGELQTTWRNPNHQVTGAGNIRALQAGRSGTLVGTRDGRVHWLDPLRGASQTSWAGAGSEVVALALCEAAELALVGSENGKVRGLNIRTGKTLFDLAVDDSAILAIAATADGRTLVTATGNRALSLWRRSDNSPGYTLFAELPVTTSTTTKLALSADGQYLAVLGSDTASVELWNLPALTAELKRLGIE